MARKKKELADWVAERLTDANMVEDGKPLAMLSVVHIVGQSEAEFVPPIRLNQGKQYQPKELAEKLQDAADTHAQDLPGVQYYKAYAFYGDSKVPQGVFPFRVSGQTAPEGNLMTEAPTKEGRMMQDMRWSEAERSLVYRQTLQMFDRQNTMLDMLANKCATLMHEKTDAEKMASEMMMSQIKLGHEQRLAEVKAVRDAELQRAVVKMLPAALHQLSGGRIFPQETADTALIDMLAEAVTEDQVKLLATQLPNEVQGLLMARFAEAVKRKEKEKAETAALVEEQKAKAEGRQLTEGTNGASAEAELQ